MFESFVVITGDFFCLKSTSLIIILQVRGFMILQFFFVPQIRGTIRMRLAVAGWVALQGKKRRTP
jgi:hypothetical protein